MARGIKDSGIKWIGKIPKEWEIGRIGQLYTERKEKVSDKDYAPLSVTMKGIVPQLSTAAKTDAHDDRKLVLKGDFAINSRSDRRGSCGISKYDGSVSLINIILSPKKKMNPVYYEWLFHSTMFSDEFYKWGHGIVDDLWTTNWQDMKKISVPMPSYKEQQAIADLLDTQCTHIDSVIEKTRAAIEEYKRLKQSIITQAVTKGIRPNRKMKDSGIKWIREIPVDWKAILITRILDYSHPYPLGDGDHGLIKTESYQQTGVPYIRVQNLSWGTDLILNNLVYISEEDNNRIINSTLKPNDILFAKTGATIGKTGIVPDSIPIANTTSHIGKLTVSDTVNSKYVFYCLSSHVGYRQFWERACLKATRPELTIDEIRSIKVILPDSFSEQSEIVNYLDEKTAAIDSLIQKKEQLISELEAYKKSLIYEYVTGKKEVLV